MFDKPSQVDLESGGFDRNLERSTLNGPGFRIERRTGIVIQIGQQGRVEFGPEVGRC